ncbi:TMEM175 family protein [Streptomyces sp. TRM70308]|uniref:TMEM175 family protein n=1 Tax=Streptomyces sp. TRM70308 TaxID=3131932 RepID=UPI003D064A10
MEEHSAVVVGPERLTGLSDGVYAIALTLLVLDISLPPELTDAQFREALGEAVPNLLAYGLSFTVIAQFWREQRRVLGRVREVDGKVVGLTLVGLALVALLPFPTAVLAEYGHIPLAVAMYAANVSLVNAAHLAVLHRAQRHPQGPPGPVARRAELLDVADLACVVVVFGASVPVAFLSPSAATLSWVVLLPVKSVIGVAQDRAYRRLREGAR